MKRIFILSVTMLAFVGSTYSQNVNEAAPNFTVATYSGGNFTLSEQTGKTVFVFTFGHNCGTCIAVGDNVKSEIIDEYSSNNKFVALSLDVYNGSAMQVGSFIQKTGITGIVGLNASSVGAAYNSSKDRLWVIDSNGLLKHKGSSGAASDIQNAKTAIENALGTTSVNNVTEKDQFAVFPNPTTNKINITNNLNSQYKAQIFDLSGRKFAQKSADSFLEFDISNFPRGIYMVHIESEGKLEQFKILKQ